MNNTFAPGFTLKNWRAAGPRFVLTDMHYEEITDLQIASALLEPTRSPSSLPDPSGTLYGWDRPLLPGYQGVGAPYAFSRDDIMNSWGSCANILRADDVRADAIGAETVQADLYVNKAVSTT